MKKLIIASLLVLLSASLVLADPVEVTYLGKSGDYKVEFKQVITKGWNLLPADEGYWSISSDVSEETAQKIKAYYLYLPMQKKYVSALGGFNQNDFSLVQTNTPYLQSSAGWYYVTSPITLSYTVEDDEVMPKLYRGWNMLSLSPSMTILNLAVKESKSFPIGDCKVQKTYFWNMDEKKWENPGNANDWLNMLVDPLVVDDESAFVGVSFAVKVKDTCQLGTTPTNTNVGAPPGIPE